MAWSVFCFCKAGGGVTVSDSRQTVKHYGKNQDHHGWGHYDLFLLMSGYGERLDKNRTTVPAEFEPAISDILAPRSTNKGQPHPYENLNLR